MNDKINELVAKIKAANNILVSVNRDPSLDQLAACIALTLYVNKLNKHGSGVFSGQVPKTIDFLKPDKTLEKNTDSLRDFIISLSKDKADKLRYKPDGDRVKIFITPYRTSISEADLEFSQGDFNVDLVLVLGAVTKQDLDQAITVNERILHDASVITININHKSDLGVVNVLDPESSSLCELVSSICIQIDQSLLDEQISTALLTGIVAETERFSNQKTSANTLSISSNLLSSGANQQLVADQLNQNHFQAQETKQPIVGNLSPVSQSQPDEDGRLIINHDNPTAEEMPHDNENVFQQAEDLGQKGSSEEVNQPLQTDIAENYQPKMDDQIDQPSPITANINPESLDPALDVLSGQPPQAKNVKNFTLPQPVDDFNIKNKQSEEPEVLDNLTPETSSELPTNNNSLDSPTNLSVPQPSEPDNQVSIDEDLSQTRETIQQVLNDSSQSQSDKPLQPVMALNAQRLGEINHDDQQNSDDKTEYGGEITIGDNGEIINHEIEKQLTQQDDDKLSKTHALKIQPLHDLSSHPELSNIDSNNNNQQNTPPPVPPPIPMNFS